MTSRDFIAAEATNTDRIILYREGLFWKAYERSAYALCSQVRPLKPTRKVLKALRGGDLISVGFPSASESATVGSLAVIERTDDRLVVAAPRPIDVGSFHAWKAAVPAKVLTVVSSAAPTGASTGTSVETDVRPMAHSAAVVPTAATASGHTDRMPAVSATDRSKGFRQQEVQDGFGSRVFRFFRRFGRGRSFGAAAVAVPEASGPITAQRAARVVPATATVATAAGETTRPEMTERRIVQALKEFDLAEKTPMDCMMFIAEWKKHVTDL